METRARHGVSHRLVYFQLAVGMAAFGSATPVSKIVTDAMPVFVGAAARVAIGALVLAPFILRSWSRIRELERRDWHLVGLIALFGMFGFTALMLYGMRMVSGVVGAIVMSTAPAVTAAGAMLFLGDRPTWRKLTSIALAVLGIVILDIGKLGSGRGDGGGVSVLGALLVFGAVCCEACYTLVGKKVSERTDPLLAAFLAAAVSIPVFVPFASWQWNRLRPLEVGGDAWMALVWYGAGTLALGSWLWYSGVARAQGSVAAGFMGVMPASALVLSYVLLDETFRWLHLAGFAVVFAGVLLISWEHARMSEDR